jgi:hypothetical protein
MEHFVNRRFHQPASPKTQELATAWQIFLKVSALFYSLFKVIIESTFREFVPSVCFAPTPGGYEPTLMPLLLRLKTRMPSLSAIPSHASDLNAPNTLLVSSKLSASTFFVKGPVLSWFCAVYPYLETLDSGLPTKVEEKNESRDEMRGLHLNPSLICPSLFSLSLIRA